MKALVYQDHSAFCDKAANIARIGSVCASAAELGVDISVFPELFTTGYNLGDRVRDLAEPIDGPTVTTLRQIAIRTGVAIVTGFAESVGDKVYNSAIAISADGELVGHHHKVFLFGDTEKSLFSRGTKFNVFELAGRRCALSICYDIEFPEAVRGIARQKAEILFNPTANMMPYNEVPITLARARALENGMLVIYANMCGQEGDHEYTGLSAIIAPNGCDLARAGGDSAVLIADLEPALEQNRKTPFSTQLTDLESWSVS